MHCHILPAVDDGSQSMETTQQMLTRARAAGIRAIVATPHYENTSIDLNAIERAYQLAESAARQLKISLYMGYEISHRLILQLEPEQLKRLCVTGTDSLLIELDERMLFPKWEYVLSNLCEYYTPIIVHPERFEYIQKDIALVSEMRNYGCEVQLDAVGLTRGMTSPEGRTARKLLSRGMADYVASDAHGPRDYEPFVSMRKKYGQQWPKDGVLSELLL